MSMNLEDCGILREDILNGVVDRLYETIYEDISVKISREVRTRLEEAIGEKINEVVETKLSLKVDELLSSEIQPLNIWGEVRGKPRTIADIMSDSLKNYWSQTVDSTGKPTNRYSETQTRVEYVVKKVARDVLNDHTKNEFNQIVLDAKASLSDALTNAVKEITDKHMGIRRK